MDTVIVMGEEPLRNISVEEFERYFEGKNSEQDIADAFAVASNKFWWVEDDVYDYEEGTKEYEEACKITDDWGRLMDFYKDKIFEILKKDGIVIPETGQIIVLEPFMKKYGYINGNGWWIKE